MKKIKLSNQVFIFVVFIQILTITIYYSYKKNNIFSYNSRSVVVIEENSEINNFSLNDLKKVLNANNQILNSKNKSQNSPVSAILMKKVLETIYENNYRGSFEFNNECRINTSLSNVVDIGNNFNRTNFTYFIMHIQNSNEIKIKNCLDYFKKILNSFWKQSLIHFLNEVTIDSYINKKNFEQITDTELVNKIYISNTHQSNNSIKFIMMVLFLILINLFIYFNNKIIIFLKKIF